MNKQIKTVGIIFTCIVIGAGSCSFWYKHNKQHISFFNTSYLDAYITDVMNTFHVPGLAIAIIKNDTIVFIKGYGVCEYEKLELINEHTVFSIGSCTKAFTAAALGILVDEGKIEWSNTAHTYLPDLILYDPYVTQNLLNRP